MSLVGTLGRVALGVVVAKGVGKVMSNRGGSGGMGGGSGGGLSGMLGGLLGGQSGGGSSSGGSMGGQSGGLAGGLAGMLGGNSSGGSAGGQSGGLGNLGALLGGKAGAGGAAGGALAAGGLGGLLEKFGGGAPAASTPGAVPTPQAGSLGHLLNGSLQGEPMPEPDPGQEALARVLIQAMVNAAKSDGTIDDDERRKIVEHLGEDTTQEEREFVLAEMRAPLDLDGFLTTVPRGAEQQVYAMSLMAITLDQPAEAQYLDKLREGMDVSKQDADAIHRELGVATLYS